MEMLQLVECLDLDLRLWEGVKKEEEEEEEEGAQIINRRLRQAARRDAGLVTRTPGRDTRAGGEGVHPVVAVRIREKKRRPATSTLCTPSVAETSMRLSMRCYRQ